MAAAAPSALEWLSEGQTIERESARTRLKDSSSTLLHQYAELLQLGEIHSREVEQQVGEVRSAVLAAGMVESAGTLQKLDDDLRRAALTTDYAQIAAEVAAVTAAHDAAADDGERRLRAIAAEMQAALRVLEANYYNCSVGDDADDED